jgi:multiple sugar transport system ATP-binding protein
VHPTAGDRVYVTANHRVHIFDGESGLRLS